MHIRKSFTLMEITVVIGILVMLIIGVIAFLNPLQQLNKAYDGKRKNDLSSLRKVLEDWYNDKGCYPLPTQICYDGGGQTTCHMCGSNNSSPNIKPYLSTLPCDPKYPKSNYLYEVDNVSCPTQYRVYDMLSIKTDPDITVLSCQNGCGPITDCNYNYGISSSNTIPQNCALIAPTPTGSFAAPCSTYGTLWYKSPINGSCNVCNTYGNCQALAPGLPYYVDGGASDPNDRCVTQCIPD